MSFDTLIDNERTLLAFSFLANETLFVVDTEYYIYNNKAIISTLEPTSMDSNWDMSFSFLANGTLFAVVMEYYRYCTLRKDRTLNLVDAKVNLKSRTLPKL